MNDLIANPDNSISTIVICWYLKLKNGKELGFTNHDTDIEVDGMIYNSGIDTSAISTSSTMKVDNLDIEGSLTTELISEKDILDGLYDESEIRIFAIDYLDPNQNRIYLRRGYLGEIKMNKEHFIAEIRGMMQYFTTKLGRHYSPQCSAMFCDSRCKMNAKAYTFSDMIVSQVLNNSNFSSDSILKLNLPSNYGIKMIEYGKIKFTSGLNTNIEMEIKAAQGASLTLVLPMPYEIKLQDSFILYTGCDKSFSMCCNVFDNAINFRGMPHVPSSIKFDEGKML